jgi:hypothetical protein
MGNFEVMRVLCKGQVAIFNLTRDMRGEARIVERAFGIGPCVLAETMQFVSERMARGGVTPPPARQSRSSLQGCNRAFLDTASGRRHQPYG